MALLNGVSFARLRNLSDRLRPAAPHTSAQRLSRAIYPKEKQARSHDQKDQLVARRQSARSSVFRGSLWMKEFEDAVA